MRIAIIFPRPGKLILPPTKGFAEYDLAADGEDCDWDRGLYLLFAGRLYSHCWPK